jgi:phage tail sheath protein FI
MMPSYTYPGVYIEEVAGAPAAIGSASPSTGAMIGGGLSGPTNEPILVSSFTEYVSRFGSFNTLSRMATSAFAFFSNGGQYLRVVRVVPNDATTASGYLSEAIAAEALTPDAGTLTATFAAFTGANGTNKTPIASGSVVITVTGGGAGFATNLTDTATAGLLANTSGATGTIDYETGEITISGPAGSTLNAPATFAINYDYKTFTFEMDWAGASGNAIGIQISGDPNYQDIATASFTRFIVSVVNTVTGAILESYDAISFTDPSSPNFIATVLNDATAGSGYVNVIANGNNEAPTAFFGTQISGENLSEVPAYNGTTKAFTYTLADDVSPFSLTGEVEFEAGAITSTSIVGSTFVVSGGNTVLTLTYSLPANYVYLAQDVAAGRLTLADAQVLLNATALVAKARPDGATPFTDNTFNYVGASDTFTITAGVLSSSDIVSASSGISFSGNNLVVTITLAAVSSAAPQFNPAALTLQTGSTIAATAAYSLGTILIADDGDGNIVDLGTGTAVGIELDSNGTNAINYNTGVITATWRFTDNPARGPAAAASQTVDYYTQAGSASATLLLSGGLDGSALTRSVVSAPALSADAKGLYALNKVEEILNICIPDFETDPLVSGDLIDYCETRKDRFCVVSVPQGLDNNQAVNYKKQTLAKNSSRAAIYYPHIRIIDPLTENEVLQPAGGHMLGIFARTDETANVSTAPAGTSRGAINFSVGLEFKMTPEQAGITNQACVNNLVEFPYTGRVVWGARTLQVGGEFPYIQMRRLFIYLEKSVFNSTQQFVFENNGAALQSRVLLTVQSFLLNLYNAGYFSGTTPAQAFFIVCDSTNNPPEKVAQGILTCDIGVAPTRPAEFIVFRFQQKALEV